MSDEADIRAQEEELEAKREALRLAKARLVEKFSAEPPAFSGPARSSEEVGTRASEQPAKRADVVREPRVITEEVLTRRKRDDRTVGGFDVPEHRKKRGWDYQWITIRVLNEPVDGARIRDFREGGWRPSKAGDWPELVEEGIAPDAAIETEGCRLYERPMSLTFEAKQEDLDYANNQQRDRMQAARSGGSAMRGEDGIPVSRGMRRVPGELHIEGVAGR